MAAKHIPPVMPKTNIKYVAAGSPHKVSPQSRITKSGPPTDKQNVRQGIAAINFEAQMQTYVSNLAAGYKTQLEKTEQSLNRDLDDIATQLNEKCHVLAEADEVLQETFANQTYSIADPENPQQEKDVLMQHRMDAFVQCINAKGKELHILWEQWLQVQHDLLCLAIEIYGKDMVNFKGVKISGELADAIKSASLRHDELLTRQTAVISWLASSEDEVKEMSAVVKRESRAYLEELRLGYNVKKRKLEQFAKDFDQD